VRIKLVVQDRLLEEIFESTIEPFVPLTVHQLTGCRFGDTFMINFTKFLLIGTLFAGAASTAFASPLTGTLDITGTAKAGTGGVINFTTNPAAASNGTGALQYFDGTKEIVLSTTFSLAGIKPGAGEMLFSMTKNSYVVDFFVTGYTQSGTTYTFTGYLTQNGVATNYATLVETIQTGAADLGSNYTAELSLTPTPEPSSIVLLGTGLLAACGMLSIKRRRMIAATI
jgi:hypothetical protein